MTRHSPAYKPPFAGARTTRVPREGLTIAIANEAEQRQIRTRREPRNEIVMKKAPGDREQKRFCCSAGLDDFNGLVRSDLFNSAGLPVSPSQEARP